MKAWKRSCVYRGEFDIQKGNPFAPLHPVVQYFWAEVESWSDEQRALLLLWCTEGLIKVFAIKLQNLFCACLGNSRTLAKRRRLALPLLHAVDAPSTRPRHRRAREDHRLVHTY